MGTISKIEKLPRQPGKPSGVATAFAFLTAEEFDAKKETKVGAYDSCPCGSGKKFKFCCFKEFMDNERARLLEGL